MRGCARRRLLSSAPLALRQHLLQLEVKRMRIKQRAVSPARLAQSVAKVLSQIVLDPPLRGCREADLVATFANFIRHNSRHRLAQDDLRSAISNLELGRQAKREFHQ